MEEPASRSQQWHEQELEKIRTEGDIALVRAQAERQQIAEADAQLRALQRQLKDKKRQFARLAGATGGAGVVGDAVALEQFARRQEFARAQLEERLKAAVSARTLELHQLRAQIDEQRRRRVDALQSEKRVVDETRRAEEAFKQSQHEAEALKERAAQLRGEIAHLQSELDDAKSSFRLERQQLQLDLDRIARPERVAVKVKVLGRKFTVFRSVAMTRKKRDALSRAKKLSLEQKVVSFEQKKVLMDRLVHESGVRTLNEFIAIYNQQEAEKAQIMARIEAKSLANGALKEVIAQLEEDITRLSGAGDIQSIVHMEQPNELKRKIDADEALIAQWTTETLAFQDALRTFRDPIRELHGELFPLDRDDECFDTTSHEVSMLRRIGAIEERVMQRVLLKILKETEVSPAPASETLKRLQRYRGALKRKESSLANAATTATATAPASGAATLAENTSPARMSVAPPSLRDSCAGKGGADDEDEEDADDYGDEPVAAVRSEDCRPKRASTPAQATSAIVNSTR